MFFSFTRELDPCISGKLIAKKKVNLLMGAALEQSFGSENEVTYKTYSCSLEAVTVILSEVLGMGESSLAYNVRSAFFVYGP